MSPQKKIILFLILTVLFSTLSYFLILRTGEFGVGLTLTSLVVAYVIWHRQKNVFQRTQLAQPSDCFMSIDAIREVISDVNK